ncbi:MAG: hypothetical protein ACTSRB_05605 [Candidatus Helarchaeota archaeon]
MGINKKDKNLNKKNISPTQLFINYFDSVGGNKEYNRLFSDLNLISGLLRKKNIQTNLIFRGCSQDNNIWGETISGEIWYWVSNGFIKKEFEEKKNDQKGTINKVMVLKYTDTGRGYFNKSVIDSEINWNLPEQTKKTLNETISSVINSQE